MRYFTQILTIVAVSTLCPVCSAVVAADSSPNPIHSSTLPSFDVYSEEQLKFQKIYLDSRRKLDQARADVTYFEDERCRAIMQLKAAVLEQRYLGFVGRGRNDGSTFSC